MPREFSDVLLYHSTDASLLADVLDLDQRAADGADGNLIFWLRGSSPAQKKSAAKKKSTSKNETPGAKKSQSTGPKDKKTSTKRKK